MLKKILSALLFALLCAGLVVLCSKNYRLLHSAPTEPKTGEGVVAIEGNIIHGAGAVDGYTTTNSLEALESAAAAGERFIELDFNLTSDGAAVCIHDWNYHFLPGYEMDAFPLSLAAFQNEKIYGLFTPVTLETLDAWIRQHDGVYIVSDAKENNLEVLRQISESYPELAGRIIPQIYSMEELTPVQELGYRSVILTVYLLDWGTKTDAPRLARFARDNHLAGVTFPYELTEEPGYVDRLLHSGVPLFTHTINDAYTIQQQLDMGITGVYTDYY